MAAPNIARFQVKRDTTNNWNTSSVKLQSGELGYDLVKKELRVGNGNDLWPALPIIGSGTGGISNTIAINGSTISGSVVNLNISYSGPNISAATVKVYVKEAGLYTTEVVTIPSVVITSTTTEIPIPINNFSYNNFYNFEILDGATKLGELEDYRFLPTITFTITPSVSSHQGIGVTYAYTGPNIKFDIFVKQGSATIAEKLNNTLTGNGSGTLYVTKGSDYSTGAYDITVVCEGTTIATSTNFAYTLPTLTAVFSDSNNKQIDLTFSSAFPSAILTCAGNSVNVGLSVPASLILKNFPVAGTILNLVCTFQDATSITISLPYNRSATLHSVSFVNLTTIQPSISFKGVSSVIFNLGEYTQTISTAQCTPSLVGQDTLYAYNSNISLTSTYGQTRSGYLTFGGQDTTPTNYVCNGAFSPSNIGTPVFTGDTNVSISNVTWTGVQLPNPLAVQLRSGGSSVATGTFVTSSNIISINHALVANSSYFIRVTLPNFSTIDSQSSTLQPIMTFSSKNAASITFQWLSYTHAKYSISRCDYVGTIISEVKPEVTISQPQPPSAISATLPNQTNFIYNEYYLVTYSFSTSSGGTYTSPVNSLPLRYEFSLALTTAPTITDNYNSTTGYVTTNISFTAPSVATDNRLKIYLYNTDSPSSKLTNFIADVTTIGSTPLPALDAGPNEYYYIACVMPDVNGVYNIIIVTSPNVLYNPSRGTITVSNFGNSPNPVATFTRSGPLTNVSFSVINGSNLTSLYTSSTFSTPTSPYVFSGYTLPIRDNISTIRYRFSMNLLASGGAISRRVFWPLLSSSSVAYDYDPVSTVSNITGVSTDIENNNGRMLSYQIKWKGFATTGNLRLFNAADDSLDQTVDANVTLDNYRTASNQYPEVQVSSLTSPLTNGNYYLRLYLGSTSGPFIQSSDFSYTATTCTITVIEATANTVRATFSWGGNPVSNRSISLVSSLSSKQDTLKTARVGSTTNSAEFELTTPAFFTTSANGTQFFLSLSLPHGTTPTSTPFTYAPLTYSSATMVFRNTPGGEQGVLYITATVGGPGDRKITYTLTEFDSSTGGSGRTVQTTGAIETDSSSAHNYTFSSSNFSFGKWYNVSYVLSSVFSNSITSPANVLSTRLQYMPKGYDILVFSGQSNMGGRDNTVGSAQAWTDDEKTIGITYRGTRAKKVVTSTDSTPVISLTNATAPFTGREDQLGSASGKGGVTLAYDFSNFYANNSLASNRDLIIVFEIRGGTGIADATNGWIGTVHRTYDALVNATEFAGQRSVGLSTGEYSRNRIAAFLWHQGESDRNNHDYIEDHRTLLDNFTAEPALTSLKLFKGPLDVIVGNIDITHNCKLDGSGFANIVSLLDSYPSTIFHNFRVSSVSSFGLRCINQDGNSAADLKDSVHFNARSERILGRRYFNAYLDLEGITVAQLEESEAVTPTATKDDIIRYDSYDVDGNTFSSIGRFSFNSSANSYIYSRNVVGYLVTASLQSTSMYSVFTEYNTTNGENGLTNKQCYLPYFINNNNEHAMVDGITVRPGIKIATSTYAFTPYILDSSYNNPEIYQQTLTGNIGDFIREIERYLRTIYPGSAGGVSGRVTSNLILTVQGILVNLEQCGSYQIASASVASPQKNVNLTLSGTFPDIRIGDIVSTSGVTSPSDISNGIVSSVSSSSKRITVSTDLVNGAGSTTITGTSRGTAIIYRANYSVTTRQFLPPFIGLRLNTSDLPTPIGSTPVEYPLSNWDSVTSARPVSARIGTSGTSSVLVAGLFDSTNSLTSTSHYTPGAGGSPNSNSWRRLGAASDMWNSTGMLNPLVFPNKTTWSIDDGNNTGILYSRIAKDTEWYFFLSQGRIITASETPSGTQVGRSRSGTADKTNHKGTDQFYATQKSGITFKNSVLYTDSLSTILKSSYEPPAFYFYNTGTGFICRLKNVIPNKKYKISYYITARSGRIPHNDTLLTPLGTDSVDNLDFYLSNPLPVRVYTATPTVDDYIEYIGDTTVIGQNVHFGVGTNTPILDQYDTQPVQTYLHPSTTDQWNGDWKYSEFRFKMPNILDNTFANYAYLQFGPLPTTRLGFNKLTNIQRVTGITNPSSSTIALQVGSTTGYSVGDRITTSGLVLYGSTGDAAPNLTNVAITNIFSATSMAVSRTQETVYINGIVLFPVIFDRASQSTLLTVTNITTSGGTTTLTVNNSLSTGDYIYSLGITPAICYARVTSRNSTSVQIASTLTYRLNFPTVGKVVDPNVSQNEYINTGFAVGGISCTIDNT